MTNTIPADNDDAARAARVVIHGPATETPPDDFPDMKARFGQILGNGLLGQPSLVALTDLVNALDSDEPATLTADSLAREGMLGMKPHELSFTQRLQLRIGDAKNPADLKVILSHLEMVSARAVSGYLIGALNTTRPSRLASPVRSGYGVFSEHMVLMRRWEKELQQISNVQRTIVSEPLMEDTIAAIGIPRFNGLCRLSGARLVGLPELPAKRSDEES